MDYKKLTETMPPIDNRKRFILWLGLLDDDGGFPALAKRVQYSGNEPYIRLETINGWKVLSPAEYKDCMWAEIETPAQMVERIERQKLERKST